MKDQGSDHAPKSLIKTPKQLVVVIVLAFAVPITSIILLTQLATSGKEPSAEALEPEAVAQRIKPVADVVIADSPEAAAEQVAAAAAAPAGAAADGETVYKHSCFACHGTGAAGAPKLGDKADWQPRVAQGKDTLYKHALGGFTGAKGMMPPRGGNASLSDAEVKAAVDYMANAAK
jgi:cytochrome c5